jgi:hypothetical protein
MILEVDVNDGAMVITADKIELRPLTNEMDLPEKSRGSTLMKRTTTVFWKIM